MLRTHVLDLVVYARSFVQSGSTNLWFVIITALFSLKFMMFALMIVWLAYTDGFIIV